MAGVEDTSTNKDRQQGFYETLTEQGIEPQYVVGHYTYDGGFQAALALAKEGQYPRAIFCANDMMAMGAMDAIRYHLKLSIPKDVAVVGFDDIDNAHWPVYNLTTVKPSVERMVQRTVDNLVESQNRDDPVRVMEVVAAQLVRRESA
ncbi:MAG: putative HTH-type transcriptional repressor ExuR [Porticoccaceae bacterium UBA1117]|nr:MAG: putative HTH-type transcriptional repressor ExuR [Porticoccaceae bacterium UBA1117]